MICVHSLVLIIISGLIWFIHVTLIYLHAFYMLLIFQVNLLNSFWVINLLCSYHRWAASCAACHALSGERWQQSPRLGMPVYEGKHLSFIIVASEDLLYIIIYVLLIVDRGWFLIIIHSAHRVYKSRPRVSFNSFLFSLHIPNYP